VSLPHLARLTTGKDPSSPEFIAERQSFLRDFATFVAMRRQPPNRKVHSIAKRKQPYDDCLRLPKGIDEADNPNNRLD
jgi:hypothetical protein